MQLRKWADLLVIAPLDANTMAKMSTGICDNLLVLISYITLIVIVCRHASDACQLITMVAFPYKASPLLSG